MVHPRWRRQGLGRHLMAHLETTAWDAGFREIWLETHTAWEAAVKLYQSLGYQSDSTQTSADKPLDQ
jgi:putative acetyltransferase